MSKLIVIEGPDRCGKATQSQLLCDYINDILKKKATVVEVPIHDKLTYCVIYWMLRNGLAKKLPKIFQWIQVLNRWIFQTFDLVNLEHEYDYIIFDRWSLSTIVYGSAEGLNNDFLVRTFKLLRNPDFTVVLLGMSHEHEAEDVYERDRNLQNKVRELYAAYVDEKSNKACVIDCERSRDVVASDIRVLLRTMRVIPS